MEVLGGVFIAIGMSGVSSTMMVALGFLLVGAVFFSAGCFRWGH